MIFFITVLRALATCLITNSHYTGVYPTDIIANGGLLGDILFFAVSGYCLYNVKGNFIKWYGKRIYRIYVPIVFITAIFMLAGFYNFNERSFLAWFIYPTDFHFAASIVVLYIPFYIIMKIEALKKRIPLVMTGIALVYVGVYIFAFDKSYYHIDSVHVSFIRFLFMESMLLGAYFKANDKKIRGKFKWYHPILLVITFVLYFSSKLLFSKYTNISQFQIVNQLLIFVLLYCIMRFFSGMDLKLEKLPNAIKYVVSFLAGITLEIYLVQIVIIEALRNVAPFPLNWFILTSSIIVAAYALHLLSKYFMRLVDFAIESLFLKKKTKKTEA